MFDFLTATAAPSFVASLSREVGAMFFSPYMNIFVLFVCMGAAAVLVSGFWIGTLLRRAGQKARQAIRAQALRRQKDHRAMVVVGAIRGPGGNRLRNQLLAAIETNFGAFAFAAPVQVEPFPVKLKLLSTRQHPERLRRIAAEAGDILEKCAGDIIIWGKRTAFSDKVELRMVWIPAPGRLPETYALEFRLQNGRIGPGVEEAIAYACARRARPVLNRPQDYKPEKLQPIVEALGKLALDPPEGLSEAVQLELLSDFASGSLSLGERGGQTIWLQNALEARQRYLDKVDRSADPVGWGTAELERGRALAALGEREGARDKLEEAVQVLKSAIDTLRASESQQSADIAIRALTRAEQTLAQRRRIGLRWPV